MEQLFPVTELLVWYSRRARLLPWRGTRDLYAIWVSEVMLQQTQVNTVIPYYRRFMERFPGVRELAAASEQEVLKLWEGLGYYSRCRNLWRAAVRIVEQYNGEMPESYDEFRVLPGAGPYIAAAVLSIGRDERLPAVDGNVARVFARFHALGDDIGKNAFRGRVIRELREVMPERGAGDFTQALMELGALICTPRRPACDSCPLKGHCAAFAAGAAERYPVRAAAKAIPAYRVSVAILVEGDRFFIQQRPSRGHLGGLWEFPGGKAEPGESPSETAIRECREELGCGVEIITPLPPVRHVYSHFKIELFPFVCRVSDGEAKPGAGVPFRWIGLGEIEALPFPGANHKIFPAMREYFRNAGLAEGVAGSGESGS